MSALEIGLYGIAIGVIGFGVDVALDYLTKSKPVPSGGIRVLACPFHGAPTAEDVGVPDVGADSGQSEFQSVNRLTQPLEFCHQDDDIDFTATPVNLFAQFGDKIINVGDLHTDKLLDQLCLTLGALSDSLDVLEAKLLHECSSLSDGDVPESSDVYAAVGDSIIAMREMQQKVGASIESLQDDLATESARREEAEQ